MQRAEGVFEKSFRFVVRNRRPPLSTEPLPASFSVPIVIPSESKNLGIYCTKRCFAGAQHDVVIHFSPL